MANKKPKSAFSYKMRKNADGKMEKVKIHTTNVGFGYKATKNPKHQKMLKKEFGG